MPDSRTEREARIRRSGGDPRNGTDSGRYFADDGLEVYAGRLEKTRPDVVVLDISMPRMNGLEAAHRVLLS